MFDYRMEHLFSYRASLQAPAEAIGPVPEGLRLNFYVTGGHLTGGRVGGKLRAEGGDWFLLRRDGVGELDVRAVIETTDGALLDVSYRGLADFGADGYDRFSRGELPRTLPLRTTPCVRTAHPDYQWLQRLLCVGVGEVDFEKFEVAYDVYAVR